MVRAYESMMILRSDLEDKVRQQIFDKVKKKIEGLKGKVLADKIWAKERRFYYPIKGRGAEKKNFNQGCYWLIDFSLDTTQLPDLKETIRLEERILRNIIVKKEGG